MNSIIWGYRQSRCVGAAVELGLPEQLAGGPRTAADLAAEAGAHEPSLRRLLRALVAMGVVTEDASGRFAMTPLGEELRNDRLGPLARLFSREQHWRSWARLDHSIRTGERSFDFVHGMRNWDYYATHPEEGAIFDAAMSANSRAVSKAVANVYDFSRFPIVGDVGGGDGTLLIEILHRNPTVRALLFDRPDVIDRAKKRLSESGVLDRCQLVGGSFFDTVPTGAGVYLMKSIIHDWDDDEVEKILERCRAAVGNTGARLLLVERVLPEHIDAEALDTLLSDLNMLANPGGRERTGAQYGALLARAGFMLERIIPTGTPHEILESVPV